VQAVDGPQVDQLHQQLSQEPAAVDTTLLHVLNQRLGVDVLNTLHGTSV